MAATRTRRIGVRFTSNLLMVDVMKHIARVWSHVDVTLTETCHAEPRWFRPASGPDRSITRSRNYFDFGRFNSRKRTPVGCDRLGEANTR